MKSVFRSIGARLNSRGGRVGALTFVAACCYAAYSAKAEGIPSSGALVYSGLLTDVTGAALASPQNIDITVYDDMAAGDDVCGASFPNTTLDATGRFQVTMPDTCVTAVAGNPDLWVEVKVGATTLGRTKIGAVPFAVEADNAAHLNGQTSDDFAPTSHEHSWADLTSGTSPVPAGAVMAFNLAACPAGWTALDAARGRVLVGLPSGGTLAGTVGTALTNLESRAHTHTLDPDAATTASAGAHTHTVDPASVTSGDTSVSHTHSIDPVSTTSSTDTHKHQWSQFDTAEVWRTWDSDVNNATASAIIVDWTNGVEPDTGIGLFPLAISFPDPFTPDNVARNYYTSPDSHSHTTDIASFTSGSSSATAHGHSVNVGATVSTSDGAHTHDIDIGSTSSSAATTANVIPYIQLLYCQKT